MSAEIGPYIISDEPIEINAGRPTRSLSVWNTGDRAIQVGSHFHFFEVNRALRFDRQAAFGMRLNIPAGTAVRFEPGDRKDIDLVAIGGNRRVSGLNGLTEGNLDSPAVRIQAIARISRQRHSDQPSCDTAATSAATSED